MSDAGLRASIRDPRGVGAASMRITGSLSLLRDAGGGAWAAARRGASPGPADAPHLAAARPSAEEEVAAIRLEPRNDHAGRHLEPQEDLPRSRIDSPEIALVAFPRAVPQLSVDPGDAGDEAVGLDRAKDGPRPG